MRKLRAAIVPVLLVLAPLAVLILSARTVDEIGRAHEAEHKLETLRTQLVGLQILPWDPGSTGLSQMWARAGSVSLKVQVQSELDRLERGYPDHSLRALRRAVDRNIDVADSVAGSARFDLPLSAVSRLTEDQRATFLVADRELGRAQDGFGAEAAALEQRRRIVAVLVVLVLATSTAIAVVRSRRALRHVRDLAAENAALLAASRDEARSDPLTRLGNRRALYDALEERFRSPGAPFVLAMFDLDDFKELNDRHGHPAGDAALEALADRLRRAEGEAFRLGGDEFCLLAPTVADALEAQRALVHQHADIRVTASVGCVEVPHEAGDVASAMRLADNRLYADKRVRRPAAA